MPQTLTLTLPDNLYQPVDRVARAINKPVEAVLIDAIRSSLPPLDGLPDDLAEEITELENMDNDSLRHALYETVPADQQKRLESFLRKNRTGVLSTADQKQLDALQKSADLVMLRKARAAVLLRFRGKRLPILSELHQSTIVK